MVYVYLLMNDIRYKKYMKIYVYIYIYIRKNITVYPLNSDKKKKCGWPRSTKFEDSEKINQSWNSHYIMKI